MLTCTHACTHVKVSKQNSPHSWLPSASWGLCAQKSGSRNDQILKGIGTHVCQPELVSFLHSHTLEEQGQRGRWRQLLSEGSGLAHGSLSTLAVRTELPQSLQSLPRPWDCSGDRNRGQTRTPLCGICRDGGLRYGEKTLRR